MIRNRVIQKVILPVILLLLMSVSVNTLYAQLSIGDWKTHLPYREARQITKAGDRIFCGSRSGLFYYDLQYNTVNIMTKSDGLNDLEISAINYSTERQSIIIGYDNANIDILEGDEVFNIPDIERKQITANKTINNILIIDDLAYLSCGFGIVVVNLEKKEIKDTYLIGDNGGFTDVYDMEFDGSSLYAATDAGISTAEIDNQNLVDFNSWTKVSDVPHADKSFRNLCWFANRLYASYRSEDGLNDTLYFRENAQWKTFQSQEYSAINHVGEHSGKLVIVARYFSTAYSPDHVLHHSVTTNTPVHAIYDKEGRLWVADKNGGMFLSSTHLQKEEMTPNGPLSRDALSIAIKDNLVYTGAGNVTAGWNNTWKHAELNTLKDNYWSGTSTTEFRDLINLAIDPGDKNHVFGTSWGYGLLEYRNGELVERYDNTNSTLQHLPLGDLYYRIGGCVFDRGNNLWMSNSGVSEPVSVRKADGTWKSFTLDGKLKVPFLGRMINTEYDHKWIICPNGNGLFAFDVNGTIEDISDDSYIKFSVVDVNGKVISNTVYSMKEDLDGNIWIGTDKGIVVYYSPSRVFGDDLFYGQQIIVPRNDGTGLADILLGTESVTAIAIDGANRKWLGTEKSGVYMVSEDGLEEIRHFTAENSPLLSNNISDISIQGNTGVVYIGTSKGLISYKGTAIDGKENFTGVYVYPNPVRPDFDGEIVITGLVGDVNVKITDIAGNIVYEATALGGQAIWDGKTFSGDRVQTGVYMIFCTDEDGSNTHVTKLLVIN